MIKNAITLSLLAMALSTATAYAADNVSGGTITINGAISDTTCTINGGKTADFTVDLSPITVTDAGTTVGIIDKNQKAFAMTFTNCTQGEKNDTLKMYFSSANNISNDGKYLINTSVNEADPAVAKNVGFALSTNDAKSTPIALNKPFDTKIKGNQDGVVETLTLFASYYKTNATAAKIGELHSNVTYTISYL